MDPLEVAAVLATKNFSSLDEGPIENNEEKHYRGTSRYVDRYLHIIHDDELLRRTVALEISFHEDYNDGSAACRQSRHVTFLWRNIVDYGQPPMSDFDCTRMIIELERRPTCDEIPSSESAVTTTTTTSAEVTILQFTISILQRVHSYNMVLSADSRPSYDVVALQCRVAGVSKNHPFCDWGLGESYNRSHTHHHDQMQSLKEGGGRYQDSSSIIRGTSAERKTLLDDIADPVLFRHLQQASISNTRAKPSILGQVLWNYTTGNQVQSSPTVVDGVLYVGSFDKNIYALDAATGQKLWAFITGRSVHSSPTVVNGVVYVGSFDGNAYAINATTGQKLWTYATISYVYSSPTVVDGVLYIGDESSYVYAITAATGAMLWNCKLAGAVYSSPTVVGGVLYVSSWDNNIYALGASTGLMLWTYTTGSTVASSPTVVGGVLYVGSDDNNIYALNATTGLKLWNYTTENSVESSPTVVNGVLYAGSDDRSIYAINATTGQKLWSYATRNSVQSSPTVVDGVVYVGSGDNNVYALNSMTGEKLWAYTTGSGVSSSPTVIDGVLYVGSDDNNTYAIVAAYSFLVCGSVSSGSFFVTILSAPINGTSVVIRSLDAGNKTLTIRDLSILSPTDFTHFLVAFSSILQPVSFASGWVGGDYEPSSHSLKLYSRTNESTTLTNDACFAPVPGVSLDVCTQISPELFVSVRSEAATGTTVSVYSLARGNTTGTGPQLSKSR